MGGEEGLIKSLEMKGKGKMFKQKKGEQATAIDLKLGFESGFLTLTGDGFKFRISREDTALLVDPAALRQAFEDADGVLVRRVFDSEAAAKFVKIGRLMRHGLDFARIGKLVGEDEEELRAFYNWCLNERGARGEPVAAERARQNAVDILPLVIPKQGQRPGEDQTEIQMDGSLVKRLLERNDINAARELGIDPLALDGWLEANSAMMALIS